MAEKTKVVIVGAGFGGVKLAKDLAKNDNVHITIVDRCNHHLFQPLLYQVSSALLDAEEIAYPIRAIFRNNKNVDFYMAAARGIDKERKVLLTSYADIPYDYIVFAVGCTTNFFGNENVEKHSYPMKTLQEAIHLRNHIIHQFERAVRETDPEIRKKLLSFVIVGGGPTGVEEAGALTELFDVMKKEYRTIDFDKEVSVYLLEATDKVLPMLSQKLIDETVRVLRKKGVDVRFGAMVTDASEDGVTLKDGTVIETRTLIWASGVKAQPFLADLGFEVDRGGRIVVNEKLQVKGERDIFAIGDCASFMHGDMERPLPTVAPVATQGALVASENIQKLMKGQDDSLKTLRYKDLGTMATIGRGDAVLNNPFDMSGIFAWIAWMAVHLIRLAGPYTNVTVVLKWIWNFFNGTRVGRIITNQRGLSKDLYQG
ncbi:NAD(P)/FAD-dependent oxidoreductase [Selenomonas sp. TAMA-11512]|uniref:NAD(P)/FAD-dependent oxidoreductase n=1 Tax=Selenomonas sp. TAMA-11512 TaxID=3095337 RepID=UPI00308B1D86|nr:NAD(P)/FAD-dependent oxidoreductase [Selenomonas sp. TAMA-11512]